MPDNITAPAAGTVFASDEISGVHYPRTKLSFGAEGSATDVSSAAPLPTSIIGTVPVSGTFWQATQPVSIAGTVTVSGALTDAQLRASAVPVSIGSAVAVTGTFFQATQPVSAASLPLPTGAGTAANQATIIGHVDGIEAGISTIGTRAYGAPLTRVAIGAASAQSAVITATEVMVHASSRCFILAGANPTATTDAIPLEAGEKFTLRITSGHRIAVIRDTADGFLNVIPVA